MERIAERVDIAGVPCFVHQVSQKSNELYVGYWKVTHLGTGMMISIERTKEDALKDAEKKLTKKTADIAILRAINELVAMGYKYPLNRI